MIKKKQDTDVVQVVNTDIGKIGLNTRNGNFLSPDKICQKCGNVLSATDYLDYICNKCERE